MMTCIWGETCSANDKILSKR